MALQQAEKDQFGIQVAGELSHTPYAISSQTLLSGGTANFLFRGTLVQPLPDGAKTVFIKHSEEFVSASRDFLLDVSRCLFEEAMLKVLQLLPSITVDNIHLRTPRLYLFDEKTNTQVLEDLVSTIDLKTVLESPTASTALPYSFATGIGRALGAWLQSFHTWVSEPAPAALLRDLGDNEPMRKIRYSISYGAFTNIVKKFPKIWERCGTTLEEVRDMATAEYSQKPQNKVEDGSWGIIHADFWSGNILIPDNASLVREHSDATNLFIIDWELAQFGRREYDLGQMIGDLYERKHFMGAESALWIIQGFTAGYGVLNDEQAFRIAIHVGVHLICWYIRRNPMAPFTEPPEQIENAIRIGTDFIEKGWKRDRAWFKKSELACLFKRE